MTLQELAAQYEDYLTTDKRDNGETFLKTKDTLTTEQADKMTDLVYDAHDSYFPDDFRYEFIGEALCALSEHDDPDDIHMEPDVYDHDLLKWLASHLDRSGYCDEAASEFGCEGVDTIQRISMGQYMEKQEVLGLVRTWLENELEDLELEEESE